MSTTHHREAIIVASRKCPAAFAVLKYKTTRYMRRTLPEITQLTPLAAFLAANCPRCVAGSFPAFEVAQRVRCYNGKSAADTLRSSAAKPDESGRYHINGMWFSDQRRASQMAETIIRCYGLDSPAQIDDWRFDVMDPRQSDTNYWNSQANRMISAGVVRVQIGAAEYSLCWSPGDMPNRRNLSGVCHG